MVSLRGLNKGIMTIIQPQSNSTYEEFLQSKDLIALPHGINIELDEVNPTLFDFQRDIVRWACLKGRAAIFADTGLGKTVMQLEWARLMAETTLIIAPLAVAQQTIREGERLGTRVVYVRSMQDVYAEGLGQYLFITNYEMIKDADIDH